MSDRPDHQSPHNRLPLLLGHRIRWGTIGLFAGTCALGAAWEAAYRDDIPRAIAYVLLGGMLLLHGLWWAFAPREWVEKQREAMRQPIPLRRVLFVVPFALAGTAVFWYVPDAYQSMLLLLIAVSILCWDGIPKVWRWLARKTHSHQDATNAHA